MLASFSNAEKSLDCWEMSSQCIQKCHILLYLVWWRVVRENGHLSHPSFNSPAHWFTCVPLVRFGMPSYSDFKLCNSPFPIQLLRQLTSNSDSSLCLTWENLFQCRSKDWGKGENVFICLRVIHINFKIVKRLGSSTRALGLKPPSLATFLQPYSTSDRSQNLDKYSTQICQRWHGMEGGRLLISPRKG